MAVTPVRERTRRDIAQQAMALFARKGYEATSLQDIATAAGCSKATVLYHFNGKPAVLLEVLEPAATALTTLITEASELPPAAGQEHLISGFVDLAVRFRGLTTVLHNVRPPLTSQPGLEGLMATGQRLVELLAASDDPRELALAGFAVNGILAECREAADSPDEDLRDICDTALRRLLLPGSTHPTKPAIGPHS